MAPSVKEHLLSFFSGHTSQIFQWQAGPMMSEMPSFRVLQIAPGPKFGLYTYVSLGASGMHMDDGRLEFAIFAQNESSRYVELVTMAAYYHKNQRLGLGDTFPLGEPWIPGATCDHALVSLPYPLGPEFEVCKTNSAHIHILWLLPITAKEREYKVKNGLEALESKFDERAIEFWNLNRLTTV